MTDYPPPPPGAYPPPPPPAGGYQQYQPAPRRGSGLQVTAIIAGIFGVIFGLIPLTFFLAWAFGLVALIVGIMAYRRAKTAGVRQGRAGIVMGVIALLLGIIGAAIVADAFDDTDDTTTAQEGTTTTAERSETTQRRTTTTDEPAVTTIPAPTGPTTVAMGQPVDIVIDELEFDQDETFAAITLANPTTAEVEPGEFGMEPTNGLFLVVDAHVVVQPNSEGTYLVGEPDFNFVGGDNSVYEVGFATEFGPTLGYVELSAGQQASGKLIFDIPPDKLAGGKIQLDDTYEDFGEPLAFWAL